MASESSGSALCFGGHRTPTTANMTSTSRSHCSSRPDNKQNPSHQNFARLVNSHAASNCHSMRKKTTRDRRWLSMESNGNKDVAHSPFPPAKDECIKGRLAMRNSSLPDLNCVVSLKVKSMPQARNPRQTKKSSHASIPPDAPTELCHHRDLENQTDVNKTAGSTKSMGVSTSEYNNSYAY